MDISGVHRRRFLQSLLVTGGAMSAAGCSSVVPVNNSDSLQSEGFLPIVEWLPEADNHIEFAYTSRDVLEDTLQFLKEVDAQLETTDSSNQKRVFGSDPLLATPFFVPVSMMYAGKPLLEAGLSDLYPTIRISSATNRGNGTDTVGTGNRSEKSDTVDGKPETSSSKDLQSSVTGYGIIAGVYIVHGQFRVSRIGEVLQSVSGSQRKEIIPWVKTGEENGFQLYRQPVDADVETPRGLIAVSDNFVLVSESVSSIERMIQSITTDTFRGINEHSQLEWAIRETGSSDVILGEYGTGDGADRDETVEDGSQTQRPQGSISGSITSAIALDWDRDEFNIEFAAVYEDISSRDTAKRNIDGLFGKSAVDMSLSSPDNNRLYGNATYEKAVFFSS